MVDKSDAGRPIQGGTLRASNTFPGDRHLIELWAPNSQPLNNTTSSDPLSGQENQNYGIYYEDITFRDILFDSSFRGGGLLVIDSARIRINNCFFLHFTTEGILVERGHETFISSCFLGQHSTIGGDKEERDFSGTGIVLASNDNAITDVVIFSAATGIILKGQANMVTGVHCYNKATYFGGVGILVQAAQTRIDNCYLDFNAIVIEDPSQIHVSNGFFLGDGNIVLKSIKGQISGLTIVNNMFCGAPQNMVPIVKLEGQFTSIDQVVIDHNNVNGMSLKSTVAKLAVAGNGTRWVADFSSVLVFPNRINHVQYSFYFSPGFVGFPGHGVTNVSSNVVVVESDKAVDGVVFMEPDCLDDLAYAIMYEMSKLCYRVSEADVTRACNQLKSSLLLHIDGTCPVAEDIGCQLLTYGRRIPFAELFARIDAVDASTVKRVANRFIFDQVEAVKRESEEKAWQSELHLQREDPLE
ncbi:hypothetical protein TEA_016357 [Camellia sinensis var. sinensis]|uniref:Right handed beta helix domain-containing protein n=1 Tax=Camellia sinensis var. sinensis TaxID=542762 RepID=A0A4S4DCT9_CAMSN|nr:hypothetical protein TEA_016357 [Camellia sinensis var. sinensis]